MICRNKVCLRVFFLKVSTNIVKLFHSLVYFFYTNVFIILSIFLKKKKTPSIKLNKNKNGHTVCVLALVSFHKHEISRSDINYHFS